MKTSLILKHLKEMGLSTYETKSYLSLLERNTLTVSEVSKLSEIPRANTYEALEKLMLRGMCISIPGQVKKFRASPPSILQDKVLVEMKKATEVNLQELDNKKKEIIEKSKKAVGLELEDLVKKKKDIIERDKKKKATIRTLVNELTPLYKNSRSAENPLEYIEIIKDPYQSHKRVMELSGQAKEEVLVFTKPPFSVPSEKLKEQVTAELVILKRGVKCKSIYEIPVDEIKISEMLIKIDMAAKGGEESRVIEKLPMKMAIFDSRIVVFALEDPVSKQLSLTSQVVEHRALAEGLKMLFEILWGKARDVDTIRDKGGDLQSR